MSVAIITLFACGSETQNESTEEMVMEESTESHEGHDHADMEEAAEESGLLSIPENTVISFGNIQDGDMVQSPLKIEMNIEGMKVHPAGELLEGTGHHHLIIDNPPVETGIAVPADKNHIHFGGGQTETEIELTPGTHTLTLQFADGLHRSYGEALSLTITIEVAPAE